MGTPPTHRPIEEDVEIGLGVLRRAPGIRSVWLFGSAARMRPTDWRSDLDFAVTGTAPGEEYGLWSELDEAVSRDVDLIRWEDASPPLRSEIEKGRLLYEA